MKGVGQLWAVNIGAIVLTEFNIEKVLEYIVLIMSIAYTMYKFHVETVERRKKADKDAQETDKKL